MSRGLRLALLGVAVASLAAGPATTQVGSTLVSASQPATRTASTTRSATTQSLATVDPAVEPLLAKISKTYAAAGPLQVTGEIVGRFDVAGRSRTYTMKIDGQTDGAGCFRHDAADTGLVISDGAHVYFYDRHRDSFGTLPTTPGRRAADDIEPSLINVLLDENPAVLLSLTNDPATLLRRAARRIKPGPATQPSLAGVVLEQPYKTITLWIDAADGTIRSTDVDFTPLMKARHAVDVKAAGATLTYSQATHAAPSADAFTWQPPTTATEFDLSDELVQTDSATTRPATRPTP